MLFLEIIAFRGLSQAEERKFVLESLPVSGAALPLPLCIGTDAHTVSSTLPPWVREEAVSHGQVMVRSHRAGE